jgi:hypothetical protein
VKLAPALEITASAHGRRVRDVCSARGMVWTQLVDKMGSTHKVGVWVELALEGRNISPAQRRERAALTDLVCLHMADAVGG